MTNQIREETARVQSHLIGRETINIPEITSSVCGFVSRAASWGGGMGGWVITGLLW